MGAHASSEPSELKDTEDRARRPEKDRRSDRPRRTAPDRSSDLRHADTGQPDHPKEIPKAGWVEILKRSVKQFKHDDVTDRAAALTYFGVLAIFPGVLALVSVLGLLGKTKRINCWPTSKGSPPAA